MKALIVLLAVLTGVWLWRNSRGKGTAGKPASKPRTTPASDPQEMVRCPVCGVHLPSPDAVAGKDARYCCTAHRRQLEG